MWTTLSLILHADGKAEHAMTGASRFPRHSIYEQVPDRLSKEPFRGKILSRLHGDHAQGLPFFTGKDRDDSDVASVPVAVGAECTVLDL